jgi:hypothetical protein
MIVRGPPHGRRYMHRDADLTVDRLDLACVQSSTDPGPSGCTASAIAWAHFTPRAGPSKVARNPRPLCDERVYASSHGKERGEAQGSAASPEGRHETQSGPDASRRTARDRAQLAARDRPRHRRDRRDRRGLLALPLIVPLDLDDPKHSRADETFSNSSRPPAGDPSRVADQLGSGSTPVATGPPLSPSDVLPLT